MTDLKAKEARVNRLDWRYRYWRDSRKPSARRTFMIRYLRVRLRQAKAKLAKARAKNPTTISEKGVRFIASFEGFPNGGKPYNDPVGYCTVGYGHLIAYRRCTQGDLKTWGQLTRGQAERLLRDDLQVYVDGVKRAVKVPLTQPRLDALVSFSYNVGLGALSSSTLLRRLNAKDYNAVPAELAKWTKGGGVDLPGLVRRRKAEGELWRSGRYTTG